MSALAQDVLQEENKPSIFLLPTPPNRLHDSRDPKNARSKRVQTKRAPLTVENPKTAIIVRGSSTSQIVIDALADLYALKKPNAIHFSKKNEVHPFEKPDSLEFFAQKNDTSLFIVGTHTKKRPHTLTIGRMFDYHVLDMMELHIQSFHAMKTFTADKCAIGMQPCFIFTGELFIQHPAYIMLRSLLLDFYRGLEITSLNLSGLEHVITVTAAPLPRASASTVSTDDEATGMVYLRAYRISLHKSSTSPRTPRVELSEMGPSLDLTIGRVQAAAEATMKMALRRPKELRPKKVKNIERDDFGDMYGRVHMEPQDLGKLQTRKMKGLRPKKRGSGGDGGSDEDMEIVE